MVDKTITPPAVLDPPFKEPVVDSGQIMTQLWQAWCTGVSQQPTLLTGGAVMMRSGTSRSDPLGAIAVAIVPPFTARTLSFQVNAAPTEPNAVYVQGGTTALPLDFITGLLGKDDGSGGILAVPNTDFTWFATGV